MTHIMGSGAYRYQAVDGWAKWPEGYDVADVAAVGVDRHDNVYAFNRGPHPMVVFDRAGNFLRSWGEGVFKRAHGETPGQFLRARRLEQARHLLTTTETPIAEIARISGSRMPVGM